MKELAATIAALIGNISNGRMWVILGLAEASDYYYKNICDMLKEDKKS